jgi:hypothetical protein
MTDPPPGTGIASRTPVGTGSCASGSHDHTNARSRFSEIIVEPFIGDRHNPLPEQGGTIDQAVCENSELRGVGAEEWNADQYRNVERSAKSHRRVTALNLAKCWNGNAGLLSKPRGTPTTTTPCGRNLSTQRTCGVSSLWSN